MPAMSAGSRAWHFLFHSWTRHAPAMKRFAQVTGLKASHYAVPLSLSLCAAGLEGASLGMLVPVADGIARNDLGFVWRWPGLAAWRPDALAGSSNRIAFAIVIVTVLGLTVLSLAFSYAASRISTWRDGVYASKIKAHTLDRCLSFGMAYFDRATPAAIVHALGHADAVLRFLRLCEQAMDSLLRLGALSVVLLRISWPLTLCLAAMLPLLRAVDRRIVRRGHRAAEAVLVAQIEFQRRVNNVLSCIQLVKASAMERRTHDMYADAIEGLRQLRLTQDAVQLQVTPLQQVVALSALTLVVAGGVLFTSSDHTSTLSMICAFLLVARRAVPTVGFATELRVAIAMVRPELDRLAHVFEDGHAEVVISGPREFDGVRTAIEFRDVKFAYGSGVSVLKGIDCRIEAGRTTAIVGATASGKSTMLALLARLYDCPANAILLDGVDIREFSLASLAARIAFVGQNAWLFNDTIRANLTFGLERDVSDDELRATVAQVRLGDLILRQPGGLDALIGDRGMTLSGGERQRLCIARAVLRRADVLLLDEATASLDTETEGVVQRMLETAAQGRTVVVVAHRLSTIRRADQILVVSDGAIVERGAWHELLRAHGPFAALWRAQSGTQPLEHAHLLREPGVA